MLLLELFCHANGLMLPCHIHLVVGFSLFVLKGLGDTGVGELLVVLQKLNVRQYYMKDR